MEEVEETEWKKSMCGDNDRKNGNREVQIEKTYRGVREDRIRRDRGDKEWKKSINYVERNDIKKWK